jgi:Protein of unknown function (DUF2914)
MPNQGIFHSVLAWAALHERRLGAVLFAFGFLTDLFTFGLLPAGILNYVFVAYLGLAAVSGIGAHYFAGAEHKEKEVWWRKTLAIVFPLALQYAFGGLLSGLVVFYAAHSVFAVSWPFILLLGVVYFGNEYFRMYKHFLVFQTTIFFFTLYAYSIFGLPLFVNQLGVFVFLGSTLIAVVLFSIFLWLLRLVNKKRFQEGFRQIVLASGGIVLAVSATYFMGLIPPIPLALADSGMYHSINRIEGGYRVTREETLPWWHLGAPVVHQSPGEYIYAFSAVAAPIRFGTNVVHRWERNIPGEGWTTDSKVSFPISGGREGGYRGYSMRTGLTPGDWRVSVETESGQVIGRIQFVIERVETPPLLIEETL